MRLMWVSPMARTEPRIIPQKPRMNTASVMWKLRTRSSVNTRQYISTSSTA